MCGIVGWIDWERDLTREAETLGTMTRTLAARGPDASGQWIAEHAALGHQRLIVVDPEGGAQPMERSLGPERYAITYNGELYNTPEIRRDLSALGYTFRTQSDTEALLLAFFAWGPACLEHLNGIFAFGIWDETHQRLFAARDRLGVKPLFFTHPGQRLLFASEIKALLAHPAVEATVDAQGLAEILVMGPARTPGCGVFRDIHSLRPGECLTFTRSGLSVHSYWSLQSHPHPDDVEQTKQTVFELLRDAVQRQLVADVPVCTLLSGGLDSSAITAFAAQAFERKGKGPLHTYSVEYRDNEQHFRPNALEPTSDAPWVQIASQFCHTEHHVTVLDSTDLVDALDDAMQARDLPGMADIDASLLLFSRAVKEHATVALSGESADEVFGGYPWFRNPQALGANTFPWARMVRERIGLLQPEVVQALHGEEYGADRYADALHEVPRLPGEPPEEARMREMLYLNITRFMPILLDRKDRMSMAAGLEVRVPFCDHRLVEYVWNIPWAMKDLGGREKGILRAALAGTLPETVLARRKSPYPKTHHPAYLQAVRNRAQELLADPSGPLRQLIAGDRIRAIARGEDTRFEQAWFSQLMREPQLYAYLIQIDRWLRTYRVRVIL